ncbi:Ank2 [Symbiodinium sp. KB8]|nr:Ank2 [Symbiodinium sp. KB8]
MDRGMDDAATPLLIAAMRGQLEVARLLLESKADMDKATQDGATPLFYAAQEGQLEDKATQDGTTPLFIAAQEGQLEVARLLLEANADTDKAMQDGATPLYVAAAHGQPEVARLLLEANADMDKAAQNGSTPLCIAAQRGHVEAELWCMTEAVADALNRAEMRLMERAEVGVVSENAAGALSSIAASMAEASAPLAATAETAAVTVAGLEAETVLTASAVAAVAAIAARSAAQRRVEEAELELSNQDHTVHLQNAWRAVLRQHPEAVLDNNFLGEPFGFEEVKQRWPRLVQTLGISEDQALKIIEADATPLLVESDAVSEVLARLAAISSREKALELVHRSPSLLAAAMSGKAKNGIAVSTLVDMLYAGRLYKVLEEEGRSNAGKLAEIELYANLLSAFRPCVDLVLSGHTARDAKDATRRIFRSLQDCAPNESIRVLLQRVAAAADPWSYLADQTRAGFSIGSRLVVEPSLTKKILPHSTSIVSHLPSIYTRLSILGPHVPGIVRILDQYLDIVEPHLDRIMERMDRIEPHLPYILLHLEA